MHDLIYLMLVVNNKYVQEAGWISIDHSNVTDFYEPSNLTPQLEQARNVSQIFSKQLKHFHSLLFLKLHVHCFFFVFCT